MTAGLLRHCLHDLHDVDGSPLPSVLFGWTVEGAQFETVIFSLAVNNLVINFCALVYRGHNSLWRELMTTLINAPTGQPLDLMHFRHALAGQLVGSIRPREFNDKMRELERYLAHKK